MSKINNKVTINKISLFVSIMLAISTFMLLAGTPLFEPFFYGKLAETVIFSNFTEKLNRNNYYSSTFKYKHIDGKSIHNVSIDFQINNSGSIIDVYEPYFKTLWSKNNIKQEKGQRYVRLEIPEIRPNDEFDIRIYSKTKPDIKSSIVMKDGKLVNQEAIESVRNPVYWIIAFIVGFFIFSLIIWYWTIKKLQLEKERIIGERDALQNIVLAGDRLTSRRE